MHQGDSLTKVTIMDGIKWHQNTQVSGVLLRQNVAKLKLKLHASSMQHKESGVAS